jgi:hypothetical protein
LAVIMMDAMFVFCYNHITCHCTILEHLTSQLQAPQHECAARGTRVLMRRGLQWSSRDYHACISPARGGPPPCVLHCRMQIASTQNAAGGADGNARPCAVRIQAAHQAAACKHGAGSLSCGRPVICTSRAAPVYRCAPCQRYTIRMKKEE